MARQPGSDLHNPDFSGSHGRAWAMQLKEVERTSTGLGDWLIEDTVTHPFWNYHVAALVHLRPLAGVAPAVITRHRASHEFMLMALDPKFENEYDPTDLNTIVGHIMTPPDYVGQLVLPSDQRAITVCQFAIQKCVNGELPADADYRAAWDSHFADQENLY